jgi:hypothetical protein
MRGPGHDEWRRNSRLYAPGRRRSGEPLASLASPLIVREHHLPPFRTNIQTQQNGDSLRLARLQGTVLADKSEAALVRIVAGQEEKARGDHEGLTIG